ncbi:hypothetical protein ACTFIT_005806 [Dictyostelium discoideum]
MNSIENNNKIWLITGTSSALTSKPEEIIKEIKFEKDNLLIVKTDITNNELVKNAVTNKQFGRIDVLVNNAGYGLVGAIEELSDSEVRKIYDVNVFGVLNLLRNSTPYFRKQKSGLIINISSQMGWDSMRNYSAYSSTKHAVNAITLSAQKEFKPFGVNVILIFLINMLSPVSLKNFIRVPIDLFLDILNISVRLLRAGKGRSLISIEHGDLNGDVILIFNIKWSNGFLINNFNPFSAYLYDMNNDGIGDIMINRGHIAIDIIYGSRGPFTSPYIPVYDGVKSTSFSFLGCSIDTNTLPNAFGDFNNDGLNDFGILTRLTSGDQIAFLVWGKTEYPPTTTLSINLNPSDGLVITVIGDINNDGFADFLISGNTDLPFTILYGNNKNYASNPIYLKDQVGDCSIMSINGYVEAIDIGDYNSDGIHDITAYIIATGSYLDIYTLYGQTSIGSISIIGKLFLPNPVSNTIYKLFENNINSEVGQCAIRIVTLTIENSANEDQFIIDPSFNSSIYSIAFNNNTRVRIELILFGDESKSIANDVLPKITVSLSPQLFNRTVLMKYGNQVQSINAQIGTCNPLTGCQCINDHYGDFCELKDCTVPQCLNGGSYNTTVDECSCPQGYEGTDCSGISCSASCLNGGSCNTTVGECSCPQGYEGMDCSGISCPVSCLNGGSCNTMVGDCSCINGFYGDDCDTKDCTVPQCLNGGSCNTTVGECSCTQGYEGIDCSGISCSVSCLNGGLCNTTVGQCQCVEDYEGDGCGSENKKKINIGVIIGRILDGLALIAIIVVAIVLIKKKKNGNSKKNTNNIELRPQSSTVDIQMGGRIKNLDKF